MNNFSAISWREHVTIRVCDDEAQHAELDFYSSSSLKEEFEDTKGVIRIRKSKKNSQQWPKEKVQKDKQRSTKHTYKLNNSLRIMPLHSDILF